MPVEHELAAKATGDPLMSLTDRQKVFVECLMKGQLQTQAARSAGYNAPGVEASRLMQNPKIINALAFLHSRYEKSTQMTRKQVMEGFKDAIDLARVANEPGVMVAGWREIGRMCGYYAPEKRVVDVNITAKRAVDKLETLSDAELMEMIESDGELIEGEAVEVLEEAQTVSDALNEAAFPDD